MTELVGAHPIGAETIKALLPTLVAYSLHTGRYRAATWITRLSVLSGCVACFDNCILSIR